MSYIIINLDINAAISVFIQFVFFYLFRDRKSLNEIFLVFILAGTSRLIQVVGINHLKYSKLLSDKSNVFSNSNILTVKRYLATKNKNTDGVDTHSDLYKPSTAKKATPVSNELHSGQPPETFDTGTENSITAGGKVW